MMEYLKLVWPILISMIGLIGWCWGLAFRLAVLEKTFKEFKEEDIKDLRGEMEKLKILVAFHSSEDQRMFSEMLKFHAMQVQLNESIKENAHRAERKLDDLDEKIDEVCTTIMNLLRTKT